LASAYDCPVTRQPHSPNRDFFWVVIDYCKRSTRMSGFEEWQGLRVDTSDHACEWSIYSNDPRCGNGVLVRFLESKNLNLNYSIRYPHLPFHVFVRFWVEVWNGHVCFPVKGQNLI